MTKLNTSGPYHMYIDGEWREADSLETLKVINPATLEIIGEVPMGADAETREAVIAAEKAFYTTWSKCTNWERADLLEKIAWLILENKEDLAQMITLESGKPINESRGEVVASAENFSWYAEESKRIQGEIIASHKNDTRLFAIRQPMGVAALITPWNFPLNILSRKIASALAAGCTVVAKPSEETPLCAVLLWRIFEKAGLPRGVANLVTGDPIRIGREIIENPIVKVIGFTGSTETGKRLMQGASQHVKKVILELGGHAPAIVFEDADIDLTVNSIIANKFRNAGQTCSCINRIYAHRDVYDTLIEKLTVAMNKLKVGNGLNEDTEVGPLINKSGLKKVAEHVQDATSKGASILTSRQELYQDGSLFYPPTLLSHVSVDMRIMNEETFGPVLPVVPFQTEEEVIALANHSQYGLYAFFYTNDLSRCIRVSEKLEFGMVGVNEGLVTSVQVPMGGYKLSGLGKEGGRWGMEEFMELKYVAVKIRN